MNNTEVLLIPNFDDNDLNKIDKLNNFILKNNIIIPVILEGALEVTETYKLYRRTLEKPDIYNEHEDLDYMELLIDKYGYVRSRNFLNINYKKNKANYFNELYDLFFEAKILEPPDEHVH